MKELRQGTDKHNSFSMCALIWVQQKIGMQLPQQLFGIFTFEQPSTKFSFWTVYWDIFLIIYYIHGINCLQILYLLFFRFLQKLFVFLYITNITNMVGIYTYILNQRGWIKNPISITIPKIHSQYSTYLIYNTILFISHQPWSRVFTMHKNSKNPRNGKKRTVYLLRHQHGI